METGDQGQWTEKTTKIFESKDDWKESYSMMSVMFFDTTTLAYEPKSGLLKIYFGEESPPEVKKNVLRYGLITSMQHAMEMRDLLDDMIRRVQREKGFTPL